MSAIEIIDIGAVANDGTGDPLRTAFDKINHNFGFLGATSFITSTAYTVGTTPQVIYQTPVATFTQGIFQIRSSSGSSSQDIILNAQITNDLANVSFVGYGTTFVGTALTNYSMDVSGSNMRILTTALADGVIFHFISAQVTFEGTPTPGISIALDGYTDSVLTTENGLIITTEL